MRAPILTLSAMLLAACSDQSVKAYNNTPEAVITSHVDGDTAREGYPETLAATVTDANDTPDDLLATWTLDGESVLDCVDLVPGADGSVTCEVALAPGSVAAMVLVRDPQNATGTATVTLEVVATDAPTAEVLQPVADGKYYSDQPVALEGLVGDGEDAIEDLVVSWESSLDGPLAGATPDGDGLVWGSASLAEGDHVITLSVVDTSGKEARDSVAIVVGPANSAPSCAITAPPTGAAGPAGETVVFSALAEDVDIDNSDLLVEWSSDRDGDIGTSTPDSDGTVTFPISTLSVETHTVTLTVTDEVGASCTASTVYTVGTAPTLVVTAPTDGDVANEGEAVAFAATVSDGEDTPSAILLSWESDVDGEFSTQGADATGVIAFSASGFTAGPHTLTVTATDTDGLIAQQTLVLNINQVPTVPTLTLAPDPAYTTDTLTASASGSVDPDASGTVTYGYAWYVDGTLSAVSTSATFPSSDTQKDSEYRVVVTPTDGTGEGPSAEALLIVQNSAPVLSGPTLSASTVQVGDVLTCAASATDADAIDTPTVTYVWSDGSAGATYAVTAADDPGDVITCTATADDLDGGTDTATASATVANTAPVLSGVAVTPSTGQVGDVLTCSGSATDADGDTPSLTYAWSGGATGSTYTITASDDPGDVLTCTVTASDSDGGSDSGSASATVLNSDPVLSSVSITPDPADNDDTLTCTVVATDADGDTPTVAVTWTNTTTGGVLGSSTSVSLSSATASSLDTILCSVSISDPDGGTDSGSASITLDNREPTISGAVSLTPATPSVTDTLTCAATGVDDDGDTVTLSYAWTVGATSVGTGTTLSGAFSAGDVVTCTVTPDDGKGASSGTASSASVTIQNTAPTLSSVTLTPSGPRTNDTLTANGSTSDADGDTVTIQWDFYVGSTLVQSGSSSTLSGASWFDKNDTVYVIGTPSDGTTPGSSVTSATVTVLNTAPGAPSVSVSPTAPAEGVDDLLCSVDVASGDDDADTVTYSAAWTVNGAAFSGSGTTVFTGDTVFASDTTAGDVWVCTVTPSDGDDDGATDSATVTVESALDDLIVDGTTETLSAGTYAYDEVQVINGGTLVIEGVVELDANSFYVEIGATVDGDGEGAAGGALNAVGLGTGGGGRSSTGGGGGGGYGGTGGRGGYDSGDSPGAGGSAYGSSTSTTIFEGSGGGSTDSTRGGAGGGAIAVTAADIIVDGTITMDGVAGAGGTGRNAGGGSGGGVLLIGDSVEVTGVITATGGRGGSGSSTANDGGGGGGGGRIKIFYDTDLSLTGSLSVAGGGGGTYGSIANGAPGGTGSTHTAVLAFP